MIHTITTTVFRDVRYYLTVTKYDNTSPVDKGPFETFEEAQEAAKEFGDLTPKEALASGAITEWKIKARVVDSFEIVSETKYQNYYGTFEDLREVWIPTNKPEEAKQ